MRTRLETRHMVPDGDRILVLISGSMNNFANHRPMVTGNVRAWLKYLLDKLFDQEGSNCSSPLRNRSSSVRPSVRFPTHEAPGNGYLNLRRSKPRSNVSASCIAWNSFGKCRGSF